MIELDFPLWADFAVFAAAAAVIAFAGVRAATLADQIADRTGMGEALTGTLLLGFLTALPGLLASIVAASRGLAVMAISNAMGGIAVQTTALAVADIAYRRANLEHAAASVPNMMQVTLLIVLLVLVLCGLSGPDVTVGGIHPVSLLLVLTAFAAFRLVVHTRDEPMWVPRKTDETVVDEPEPGAHRRSLKRMVTGLVVMALLTGLGGALVAESAENIMHATGLPETVVGGLLMALATSLPELVTSVAAVRRGALTLAVSDIVGGNFFDVLFVAAADVAWLHGSVYHADGVGLREIFLTSLTILLNLILLGGLLFRQKRGPANIGVESVLMLVVYLAGFCLVSLAM